MKRQCFIVLLTIVSLLVSAQKYAVVKDISYTSKQDEYSKERLKLDVYYPENAKDCPVVVWFHGGGLTSGNKELPWKLKEKGMVVVGVNYRLLPKVTVDKSIDDAAEAVAWTMKNIQNYGGSVNKIFVAGHSAGGYLTMMMALNKQWLSAYGVDADSIASYIPFSGQAVSHFSYRQMKGIGNLQPIVDEFAPLYWVRNDCPPMVLIVGDRELELFGRYEENAYLWRMMKLVGHEKTYLYELGGHDHGQMADPAFNILVRYIKKMTQNDNKK